MAQLKHTYFQKSILKSQIDNNKENEAIIESPENEISFKITPVIKMASASPAVIESSGNKDTPKSKRVANTTPKSIKKSATTPKSTKIPSVAAKKVVSNRILGLQRFSFLQLRRLLYKRPLLARSSI